MIYLDTHIVVDLYQGDLSRFTKQALRALDDEDDLRVSPMVVLELEYLREIKRIKIPARRILQSLSTEIGLRVCDLPFNTVVDKALEERWTRDPFDRLILAQARHQDAALITRDEQLQRQYSLARA